MRNSATNENLNSSKFSPSLFINKFSVLIIAKLSNITKSLYHQTKISLKQIVNFICKIIG